MKLYYSPGACSLVPHITLIELGFVPELVRVSLNDHKTQTGEDYYTINFKGAVPLLELDNGERLSEGLAITQYLADLKPEKNLIPPVGVMARYRVIEWQSSISDIHRCFSPLFHPANVSDEAKKATIDKLLRLYTWVDEQLKNQDYLTGIDFTIADAYLFTTLRWGYALKLPITELNNLKAFFTRVQDRPAVQMALKAEGLI